MIMPPLWPAEVEARVQAEARNLDKQERPTEGKFCTPSLISPQRPRIVFDAEGVCSACRYADRKWGGGIDLDAPGAALKVLLH